MADYVKLHTDALDNRKIQTLPPTLVLPWMNFLLLSRLNGGILPDVADMAFRLRTDQVTIAGWISGLRKAKLIDQAGDRGDLIMHDWEDWNPSTVKDPTAAARQAKRRAKLKALETSVSHAVSHGPSEENLSEVKVMNESVTHVSHDDVTIVSHAVTETPLTAVAVREKFPNTDGAMILQIVHSARQAHIQFGGKGDLADAQIAEAVRISHWEGQKSAGPYRRGVAQVIESEIERMNLRNGNLSRK